MFFFNCSLLERGSTMFHFLYCSLLEQVSTMFQIILEKKRKEENILNSSVLTNYLSCAYYMLYAHFKTAIDRTPKCCNIHSFWHSTHFMHSDGSFVSYQTGNFVIVHTVLIGYPVSYIALKFTIH